MKVKCSKCGRNASFLADNTDDQKLYRTWVCNYCGIVGRETYTLELEKSEIIDKLATTVFSWDDAVNELNKRGMPKDVANALMLDYDANGRIKGKDGNYVIDYRQDMEKIWDYEGGEYT